MINAVLKFLNVSRGALTGGPKEKLRRDANPLFKRSYLLLTYCSGSNLIEMGEKLEFMEMKKVHEIHKIFQRKTSILSC